MRQRVLKSKEQINEENARFIRRNPASYKGKWKDEFLKKDLPLYVEIGSGKGQFICKMADNNKDANFLACEGAVNIAPRILQKAGAGDYDNLLVIMDYIITPSEVFSFGELDGVYLNFSDPWPKDRHAHRRLTHISKLLSYREIMKPGSFLVFKTDNDALFDFSIEQIKMAGLEISELTRDLHNSIYSKDNIMTEYEEKFSNQGKTINYVKIVF